MLELVTKMEKEQLNVKVSEILEKLPSEIKQDKYRKILLFFYKNKVFEGVQKGKVQFSEVKSLKLTKSKDGNLEIRNNDSCVVITDFDTFKNILIS